MSGTVEFATFVQHLPADALPFSVDLWESATYHGVDPWHMVAVLWRESMAGGAPGYRPPHDPAGTGDFIARRPGTSYRQPSGKFYQVPAGGMPGDGGGWGRGLMQIDFAVHNEWVITGAWKDPRKSFDYAAKLLASFRKYFSTPAAGTLIKVDEWRITQGIPKYGIRAWATLYPWVSHADRLRADPRPLAGVDLDRAALAAYNAGPSGVLQALAYGVPAEACTSGQDYVSWCERKISHWKSPLP